MAGKKYNKAVEFINKEMAYSVTEAVELLEKTNTVKFDPTVEIHFNLNLEVKHADQIVRSTISLPNGSGKTARVCAFTDENADAVKAAGATIAGGEELIDDIAQGNVALDFDVCVATPSMMRHLGKVARVLGPKGLMPNPKIGTVTMDVAKAVTEVKAGKVRYRVDKAGIIHTTLGKVSFTTDALKQNLERLLVDLKKAKPAVSKGVYLKKVSVSSTMGPGISLDFSDLTI
jgi:large subunit ribosomal protein L1